VENAFHKDPRDPRNYDLMLDSARFGVVGSAKVIFEALGQLRSNTPEAVNAGV
jgi:hypothetical protein